MAVIFDTTPDSAWTFLPYAIIIICMANIVGSFKKDYTN